MPLGSPGQYPTEEFGGPPFLKFRQFQPSYDEVTLEHVYEDGGASYVTLNDQAPIIFEFQYDGLPTEDVEPIFTHRADAFGKVYGFDFKNPKTGDEFEDVHYLEWGEDHTKGWVNSLFVRLIWRPA